MEQMTGIEPAWSAWEAEVLPLNYICKCDIIIADLRLFVNSEKGKNNGKVMRLSRYGYQTEWMPFAASLFSSR